MQKVKKKIKDSFLFIEIISDEALELLNRISNRHYRRPSKKSRVRFKEKKSFKFWDRLMKTPPGYGRDGGDWEGN